MRAIFPWGGFCTDHGYEGQCRFPTIHDPILLKTHYPFLVATHGSTPKYTICLIRHPIDAFWSFNVYKSGAVSQIDRDLLVRFIDGWQKFYEYWTNQPNVLFIRYEDLQTDTAYYLNLILRKAGYTYNQEDVERAIGKYTSTGEPLKHLHHYQPEEIELINSALTDFLEKFNYEIL